LLYGPFLWVFVYSLREAVLAAVAMLSREREGRVIDSNLSNACMPIYIAFAVIDPVKNWDLPIIIAQKFSQFTCIEHTIPHAPAVLLPLHLC